MALEMIIQLLVVLAALWVGSRYGSVWQSGMVAMVAIRGTAWFADMYFSNDLTI
ncbi:MAG: hypothetical protein E7112_08715 [Bacteroidales bacterium]|nr:hypothetical protein [Bacteroidales bacterium]